MNKLLILALSLVSVASFAQKATVSSPDGNMIVCLDVNNGKPVYNVTYAGKQIIENSPLGLVTSKTDLSQNLSYVSHALSEYKTNYSLDRIKQSSISASYNQLTYTLKTSANEQYSVVFRVADNDIAFRYELVPMPDKVNGKRMSVRIMSEQTGFDLPGGTTTFLTPQSDAMVGWKGTKPSYEEEYVYDEPMTTRSQFGHGFTFPCLFHNGDTWVLISETGVDSGYCGSHLSDMQGDGLYSIAFPMAEENNGNGTVEPAFALPGATPWRTITIANNLKPIVETTVAWDHVAPLYEPSQKYQYGKGTWSWIVWQDESINYDDQVRYIDLANALGYQFVLIDNWWDTYIGREGLEKLVKYANSKNVDVLLWHSSSGYWNDIEQGPINLMDNAIARKKEMAWLKKIGVKGVKIDFFGGDKQETMRLYEQILSDANDYGLTVIFHGCTLPRGWERMYPNYVGSEATLASENLFFSQHHCDLESKITSLHPFLRNTVGCMEFGGSFLNHRIGRGNDRGNYRRTTDVHELAQAVLFQNPVQNFALTPENLRPEPEGGAPEICLDFMRNVPTTWDETVFIDGYPGRYCVLARRHGDTWYIAGNNATGATLTLTLSLPMLQAKSTVMLYSDSMKQTTGEKPNALAVPQRSNLRIGNPQKVKVTMAKEGGFVMITQ